MKILHISEVDVGGTVTVLNHLLKDQISRAGTTSVCLVPDIQAKELIDIPSGNIITYKRTGRNIQSFLNLAIATIKTVVKLKPDIVHLHSTFAGVIARVCLLPLRPFLKFKIIYCPHGISFLTNSNLISKKTFYIVEKTLLFFTDSMICVSDYEKKTVISFGLSGKKIKTIYNGTPLKKENALNYKTPGKNLNILFAGRLGTQKGFDTLIPFIKETKIKNITLNVAGIASEDIINDWKHPSVNYLGWCNAEKIKECMLSSDVLILPSRWEGFPMIVLEAMSYGLPVIASNCTSLPEAIIDSKTGWLFDIENMNQLENILENITPESLKEISHASKKRHFDLFSSDVMTEKTFNLYNEVQGLTYANK